jgi:peroxiredoxin (alkyl hydroperoxide reductase subunit C)
MKASYLVLSLLLLCSGSIWAQGVRHSYIPLIGDEAPAFTAETTAGPINFPGDYGRKWKIIFSHPRDFTPVCSSELMTLSQMQGDFENLNVQIVVVSTDELKMHYMWKKEIEATVYKGNQPVKIDFPLVDDHKWAIAKQYGMLHQSISGTQDVRGVFIINPDNKVEAVLFYPMNLGRNMDEIRRAVIALQTAGRGKDRFLMPANWQVGDDVLVPKFPYTEKELIANPSLKSSYYNVGSFMCFKKM